MAAEGGFEIVRAERQEQVAQGVHRRGAPEAGAEDDVQALALQSDERDDLLVGRRAREHGENRKQQQVAHAVALTLWPARVAHRGECGKQDSEWHQSDLHEAGKSLPYSRGRMTPLLRPVRLSGTVYCHKAMRKSYSELGFRSGRSAPSAMACGRLKAYRPRKLICLKRSGETLAISA